MDITTLIDRFWEKYTSYTPSAKQIHQLFGEEITNDHIAFRTLNLPGISIENQKEYLLQYGYQERGQYDFQVKKLKAIHLENEDPVMPKIFLSELLLEQFSIDLQKIFQEIFQNINLEGQELFTGGRSWEIDFQTYNQLANESEYASWLYVWGFCPNHFTVSVNHLNSYQRLEEVNDLVKQNGFLLNESGGEIKGTPEELLEQSSILADKKYVSFSDGEYLIPSCYYEFAKRYKDEDGRLYQGFIAKSADKIFESTNT
jgi:hypothetical protein